MLIPHDRRWFLRSAAGVMLAPAVGGRTVFRRPANAVNARQRSVVGNGATDDAAAINKLIAEVSAGGGGSLFSTRHLSLSLYYPAERPCAYFFRSGGGDHGGAVRRLR